MHLLHVTPHVAKSRVYNHFSADAPQGGGLCLQVDSMCRFHKLQPVAHMLQFMTFLDDFVSRVLLAVCLCTVSERGGRLDLPCNAFNRDVNLNEGGKRGGYFVKLV